MHDLTEPCQHCEGKGYTKSRRTVAYGLLRELRRQGNLIEGDTVLVEVNPDIAQVLAGPDHVYLEEIEKRLQKRIMVKARASFAIEDFELRTPGQKALEHSESPRDGADQRRGRRRKKVGPPAEVQALLDEEERNSLSGDQELEEEPRVAAMDNEVDDDGVPAEPPLDAVAAPSVPELAAPTPAPAAIPDAVPPASPPASAPDEASGQVREAVHKDEI